MKMDKEAGTGTEVPLLTIEEFERLPDDGSRVELVRGQVVREPSAGFEHGWLGIEIAAILRQFVQARTLGRARCAGFSVEAV